MSNQCQGSKPNGIRCQRPSRTPYCYLHRHQSLEASWSPEEPQKQAPEQPLSDDPSCPSGECGICLTEGPFRELPCGHANYCGPCLETWESQNCPLCRVPYGEKRSNPDPYGEMLQMLLNGISSEITNSLFSNTLFHPRHFEMTQSVGRVFRSSDAPRVIVFQSRSPIQGENLMGILQALAAQTEEMD